MTLTKAQAADRNEAIAKLRELCPPGTTVYTILRHVSRSGMQRAISLTIKTDNGMYDIDYLVARALDYRRDDRNSGALKVGGCGMDMGFHLVNSLSYALHGYKDGPNAYATAGHTDRNSPLDAEAYRSGYTLAHRWL